MYVRAYACMLAERYEATTRQGAFLERSPRKSSPKPEVQASSQGQTKYLRQAVVQKSAEISLGL